MADNYERTLQLVYYGYSETKGPRVYLHNHTWIQDGPFGNIYLEINTRFLEPVGRHPFLQT
jgi:hypothetical protein